MKIENSMPPRSALSLSSQINLTNQKLIHISAGLAAVILFKLLLDILSLNVSEIADRPKCPFCYGEELCPIIQNNSIITNASFLDRIIFYVNTKKPIRGYMNNQDVVIKKLASSSEFKDLDRFICDKFFSHSNSTECFSKPLKYFAALNHIYQSRNVSDKLVYCGGDSFPDVMNILKISDETHSPTDRIFQYWTQVKLNPEPLLLQILKPEEGWPVPKYFGSCGRLIVVEHCGKDLAEFLYAPLPVRMNLTLQVLDLATNFTFGHKDYAFYFTDISPINLVVDQKHRVRLVDLEHVIISNKKSSKGSSGKKRNLDTPHLSEHIECNDCLAFSTDKICEHSISDHNFYAVCKEIFGPSTLMPGGFLHSPSECLKTTPPGLSFLTNNCIQPSGNSTRLQTVEDLKNLIKKCQL